VAQTGFTPIQIYRSSTASAAPTSGNLVAGELAINTADGKLFYLDNLNAVQVIGWKLVPATAGGTGLSSYTTGDILYSSATNTLAKLAIGTTGQVLTVAGGIPTWAANVSAAGSNRQIQFNNAGAFGADSGFVYNASGNVGIGASNLSGRLNINSNSASSSNLEFDTASTLSAILSYNRNTNAYSELNLRGSIFTFSPSDVERVRIHNSGGVSIGNTTDSGVGSLNVSGLIYPQQATTAGAPAYVKGAIYFDTTLNKLRVGGATAWETITSI
jgi:hypothetical protein